MGLTIQMARAIVNEAAAVAEYASRNAAAALNRISKTTSESAIPASMTPLPCNSDPSRCVTLSNGTMVTIAWGNSQSHRQLES